MHFGSLSITRQWGPRVSPLLSSSSSSTLPPNLSVCLGGVAITGCRRRRPSVAADAAVEWDAPRTPHGRHGLVRRLNHPLFRVGNSVEMAGSGSRMKKSCDCCQTYLGHLGGKMNCFLRRMTADSRRSMILPDKFANHFGGNISGTIKLQAPNCILYVVEVTVCMNKTVLKCGWEAFVAAHRIEENDYLFFSHLGNSRFEVLILDSDGCEKVFSCTGIKNNCSMKEKSVDAVSISSSSCDDTVQSSESEGFARYQKGSFSRKDSPSEHESVDSGDLQTSQEPYTLSRFSYLSDVQKERVDALIQKIQPKITVFVAIMRKSNVQLPAPLLVIASRYAALHFPHESRNVTLQRPCKSKKWHPTFYKRNEKSINILRGYWSYFVQDNRVQENDICVFVPTKDAGNFIFTVHLLRAAATYSMGGTGVDRIGSSVGITHAMKSSSDIIVKEEPIEADDVSLENSRNGVSEDSEDSKGPADPFYIVPCKSRLSSLQKKIVKDKVRSIQSKVPLYVALMKKTNVELTGRRCQLEFGARYAAVVHLPDRRQTVLLERSGKIWATVMHVKNGRSTRRFLINGWSRFVRDNRLRVGDICLFELKTHETKKLTMAVHAISSSNQFEMAGSGSRMKKSCDCCQRYLEHLDGKMNCFLRRMTANSRRSMIMPDSFVNHFGGNISGTIKLESPNGILYVVEFTEFMNKTVLKCGWEAFVDAHHIEENDSLLFRHIENSRFKVLILGSDDCEKVFSCAGIKNNCSIEEKSADPVSISSSSCDDINTAQSSESEGSARYQKGNFSHRRKISKLASSSSSYGDSGEDSPSEHDNVRSGDLQTSQEPYVLSRFHHLSESQKERVDELIKEIQPEITVFVAVMRKFNVQLPTPFLVISSAYAAVHFPHESRSVTLRRPYKSKKWHPKFYKRKDGSMNILRGYWSDFVKENRLLEQDLCVFVPTKDASNFAFTVYVLRAAATYSRGGTGVDRIGSSVRTIHVKSASDVIIREEPIEADDVSLENSRNGVSDESVESEDTEGPADPPCIVPSASKSRLSSLQKNIVNEKVKSIQSKVPIYVAVMNKTNIGLSSCRSQLEFGAQYAAAVHLPDRRQTVLLERSGKRWATVMHVNNARSTRRFLINGWSRFVRDNRLRVGDICLFELKTRERKKLTMAVHTISSKQSLAPVAKNTWNIWGGKMSYFLRQMTADSMRSMILPSRYVNHFGGKFPGTIKLESPNGILYVVEVIEYMNKTVLQCGWEAFVDAHRIKQNNSLLFRHIENSRFEVLILDTDDCEKVFSCAGIKNSSCAHDKAVDPADISGSSRDDTEQSSRSERSTRCKMDIFNDHKNNVNWTEVSSSSEELAQKERVVAHIKDIQPQITVFVAVMKKCNLQSPAPYLVISSRYASVHFPRESATITLQMPSKRKKWHPKFYKRKDKTDHMLRGQWKNFVHDNCLQEEDICLFAPTKGGRNFTFTVHLLRAAATHSTGGTDICKIGSNHNGMNANMASQVHLKEEPDDGENVSSESDKHGVSHESQESKDSASPSEPPYILSRARHQLSQWQKKKVEAKVRAIQSKFPIYVAIIGRISGGDGYGRICQLELGSRYAAAHLPDTNHQTVVLQCKGMIWQIKYDGWRKFVHDNRLHVGDFCLFELKEKKLTMEVHIIFNLRR
uniref:TF-B3 domain-containing protein n=1 Tax=Leersia perrieri TaxID=77586 RepID=A0A0D9VWF3_9ORYZ